MGGRSGESGCRPEDTEHGRRREVNKLLCCLCFPHATFSGTISLQESSAELPRFIWTEIKWETNINQLKMKVKKGFKANEGSGRTN